MGYTTRDIILQYTYPRLDSNVSIGLNHLLKSPFCVHPKTGTWRLIKFIVKGRVCVPIDPEHCELFDPFGVPTLESLIDELNAYEKEHANETSERKVAGMFFGRFFIKQDYEKTSLKPYVEHFKAFLSGLAEEVREALRAKRVEEERKMVF